MNLNLSAVFSRTILQIVIAARAPYTIPMHEDGTMSAVFLPIGILEASQDFIAPYW